MKKFMLLVMSLMLCIAMTACANGNDNDVPDVIEDNGTVVNDNETLPDQVEDTLDNDVNDMNDVKDNNNVTNGNTTVTP